MTDVLVALWWVQVGSAIWLAFVLQLVYKRVYREPFLRFWSFSFAVLGVSLGWILAVRAPDATEVITSFEVYLAGLSQFALIALAALSLKLPARSRRRQAVLGVGIFAALVAVSLVTAWLVPGYVELRRAVRFERHVAGAAALLWFAAAFWRKHPLARTPGGRATVVSTAFYALHHAAMSLAVLGLPPYPGAYSIAAGAVAALMPFAVSASMLVLASEAMIATTRKLRESEERYRTLVDASPDAIVATARSGTVLMCNRRAAEVHGFAGPSEIVGTPAAMLIAPGDRERVQAALLSMVTGGRPMALECLILSGDGERSAELTAAPLRSGDGSIAGGVTIVHDVTARKAAEGALRREREFSAHAIDAIPGIFFVLDRQGELVRWNRNLENLLGLPAEEIRQLNLLDRFHPEDRQRVAGAVEAVFADGSAEVEARGIRGLPGEVRHFYLTGRRMESDGVAYMVGCGVDITERREAEADRARLELQLLRSQKLESIGRLAGGVAHDFNNHLTVINGYCDVVMSSLAGDDPNRAHLLDVRRAGERAANLTRQLLAFGRRQFLSPRPVSLNRIVASMETMLRRLVPESISVSTVLPPGLGAVMADTGQIEQVLLNLVVNARDAMPEGGAIRIETANLDLEAATGSRDREIGPGAYVTLTVTDTGAGMDESTRALIFEPFFTTKKPGQGTGLGLATVYGIVKQSGGAIAVRSQPGEGAEFTIYLPRLDVQAAETPLAPAAEGSRSGHGTILLVEDQETVRNLVSRILRSSGYSVIQAGSGPQALALAESQAGAIDLLITDVVMPGMSGRELASRLAANREGLRVLFISGYAPEGISDEGSAGSSRGFLQKPFSPAQITALVGELLAAK